MVALALVLLGLVAFGLLIYPLMVLQPFKHQDVSELRMALSVTQWRSYVEIAVAALALLAAAWYWPRQHRIWPRVLACAGVAIVCAGAALTRINVYEIMFHHYDKPSFSPVADSKLDGGEMVIAINLHGQARAYPIRSMSYHHVVNDEVGGIPVVATY
jgi:hypothetical protein